jgi:hypothetical protein
MLIQSSACAGNKRAAQQGFFAALRMTTWEGRLWIFQPGLTGTRLQTPQPSPLRKSIGMTALHFYKQVLTLFHAILNLSYT